MKKLILLITVLFSSELFYAQQDPMFTHYSFNTLWLNPAYAGSRDALTVTGIYRSQWVAFNGAPIDQSLTMHSPILNGKMGAGLSVMNDKIGPTRSTLICADIAYPIKIDNKSKLAFGLKGLVNIYNNNLSSLKLEDGRQDEAFSQNVQSILPNVGTGVYYYRDNFYAGLSTPRLLQNKFDGSLGAQSREQRHYFLIMGLVTRINHDLKFKPTVFIKATKAAPIEADLTASFVYQNKLSAGLMYRTKEAVGLLVGYQVSEPFYLGYSFDWSTTNTTGRYNAGSHELVLRYDLISTTKAKLKSPRYF